MDENKKKVTSQVRKNRFNVLDIVIVVLILFIVAAIVMFIVPEFSGRAVIGEKVQISYTVVFENVSRDVYDKVMVDDNVTEVVGGRNLGVVSEIPESEHYYEYVLSTDESGNNIAVKKQYDDMGMNLRVTITATAVYKEGVGYTVDGYRIASGKRLELRFNSFVGSGYCENITIIGEG